MRGIWLFLACFNGVFGLVWQIVGGISDSGTVKEASAFAQASMHYTLMTLFLFIVYVIEKEDRT